MLERRLQGNDSFDEMPRAMLAADDRFSQRSNSGHGSRSPAKAEFSNAMASTSRLNDPSQTGGSTVTSMQASPSPALESTVSRQESGRGRRARKGEKESDSKSPPPSKFPPDASSSTGGQERKRTRTSTTAAQAHKPSASSGGMLRRTASSSVTDTSTFDNSYNTDESSQSPMRSGVDPRASKRERGNAWSGGGMSGQEGKRITHFFQPTQTQASETEDRAGLQEEVARLSNELRDEQSRRQDAEAQVATLQTELERVMEERDSYRKKSALVIETLVQSASRREDDRIRLRLATDSFRLGSVSYKRNPGSQGSEYGWEDGQALREIKKSQAELLAREVALKQLTKLKTKETKEAKKAAEAAQQRKEGGAEAMDHLILRELEAQQNEETVKVRLAAIRKEQTRLNDERNRLDTEVVEHRRELKRMQLQDRSKFKAGAILRDQYLLVSLLGKGGFSEVWKAFDLSGRLQEVAVKVHQLIDSWPDEKKNNYTKHATREYAIHRDLNHRHVVQLYDVFEINLNAFATVLELCHGGDLDRRLKADRQLPEGDARSVLLQIMAGLLYLNRLPCGGDDDGTASEGDGNSNNGGMMKAPSARHGGGGRARRAIIHYDLKPGNILFDSEGDAKITDFGLSKIVEDLNERPDIELTSQGAGTYWYLPPECFHVGQAPRISSKVDVWSVGVIFYQMLYGCRPFGHDQNQEQLLHKGTMLRAHKVDFPPKPKVTPEAKSFVQTCLTYRQADRPDVIGLCRHPYLRNKKFQNSNS